MAADLAELDQLIAGLEKFGGLNGAAPVRRLPKKPRKPRPGRPARPSVRAGGRPTIRMAVTKLVEQEPGIAVSEAIQRLIGQTDTDAADQRKVLSTRIGQFVRRGALQRRGDRLYLVESRA